VGSSAAANSTCGGARRWDEKAGLQARYLSVPINNELYWLNGGQP
jgi:hypothetical protein